MVDINLITKEQQKTSTWSGGTTTQIAIYPPESKYEDRDFLWRLSTAIVEVEESNFTKLAGFDRHLMVLEGQLELIHKEQHTAVLKQYEQDSFKGGWETISFGKARDFNLMLKEGAKGRLEHYKCNVGQELKIELEAENKRQSFFACYCHKGQLSLRAKEECISVEEGDLLLVNYGDSMKIVMENKYNKEYSLVAVFIEV
jgi:uncharacterized protein